MFFLCRIIIIRCFLNVLYLVRPAEDDSTTQKKVHQMLETVDKVKWKTPGHVKDEEEEKKVCV